MNPAYLRKGNTPLEQVVARDHEDIRDPSYAARYLSGEHRFKDGELHIRGYDSFLKHAAKHLEDGAVFFTYGNTADQKIVDRESSNIEAFVKDLHKKINAQQNQGAQHTPKLRIATDLLAAKYRHALSAYLHDKISYQAFVASLSPEYKAKAEFIAPVLAYAKRNKIAVVPLDTKTDDEDSVDRKDTRTARMRKAIAPGTLVIAYEDLVRNHGLLESKVAQSTDTLTISQNPTQALSNAARAFMLYRRDRTIYEQIRPLVHSIIDLSHLPNRVAFADYAILGYLKRASRDDPKVKVEYASDRTRTITTLIPVPDKTVLRELGNALGQIEGLQRTIAGYRGRVSNLERRLLPYEQVPPSDATGQAPAESPLAALPSAAPLAGSAPAAPPSPAAPLAVLTLDSAETQEPTLDGILESIGVARENFPLYKAIIEIGLTRQEYTLAIETLNGLLGKVEDDYLDDYIDSPGNAAVDKLFAVVSKIK
ncbi:hypothetical protein J4206_06580 [Candidatus Woesearchaeota archaeon]|nr:hypothetical protein [Candidatus Woesearchaeota archaeon]